MWLKRVPCTTSRIENRTVLKYYIPVSDRSFIVRIYLRDYLESCKDYIDDSYHMRRQQNKAQKIFELYGTNNIIIINTNC